MSFEQRFRDINDIDVYALHSYIAIPTTKYDKTKVGKMSTEGVEFLLRIQRSRIGHLKKLLDEAEKELKQLEIWMV